MRRILEILGLRPGDTLDAETRAHLASFERRIGYRFKRRQLAFDALVHRSFANAGSDSPNNPSNERLEFLGDAVLELVVNEFLYRAYPDRPEGDLTKMKSLLVSRNVLAQEAKRFDLGRYVFLSEAERLSGGSERASILADAFEAVVGAIYLDGGLGTARVFLDRYILSRSGSILRDVSLLNYKSLLQEAIQDEHKTYPRYHTASEDGPDHSKEFTVEVRVRGEVLGVGKGSNKKAAEQAAAQQALEALGIAPVTSDTPRSE